jgi:citrate synthase
MSDSDGAAWRTALSDSGEEYIRYRGYDIEDVVSNLDFAGTAFLLVRGEAPSEVESRVFNAMLAAVTDHGISPSQAVTRYTAASGSPIQASVAAGVLTIGDYHGGAGEITAGLLVDYDEASEGESIETVAETLVTDRLEAGKRIPGYGHTEHPQGDPRTPVLLDLARGAGVTGRYTNLALAVEDALEATGQKLPMNINGVVAALLLDLGFEPSFARPFVIMARAPGLIAHAIEETERERRWRPVAGGTTYDGPDPRDLSDADR